MNTDDDYIFHSLTAKEEEALLARMETHGLPCQYIRAKGDAWITLRKDKPNYIPEQIAAVRFANRVILDFELMRAGKHYMREDSMGDDQAGEAPEALDHLEEKFPANRGIDSRTGAMRESIGTKVDTHLVPYEYIMAAAVGLNYGARAKYGKHNYLKGLSKVDLLNSIDRHNRALMAGKLTDEDSGLPHHILLASSTAMLVATIERDISPEEVDPQPDPGEGYSMSDISKRLRQQEEAAVAAYKPPIFLRSTTKTDFGSLESHAPADGEAG